MKETGNKTTKTDLESFFMHMATNMKVIGFKTKDRVKEFSTFLMGLFIKAIF